MFEPDHNNIMLCKVRDYGFKQAYQGHDCDSSYDINTGEFQEADLSELKILCQLRNQVKLNNF